jgi:hypothetical protein
MTNLNRNQIKNWLIEFGWKIEKDEIGDKFCTFELENCVLVAGLDFRKYGDMMRVLVTPSISTEEYTNVVNKIFGKKSQNGLMPIIIASYPFLQQIIYTYDDIKKLSNDLIIWAKAQSVEQGLRLYENLPTDSKGRMPLCHLASLAILGNVEKLAYYLNSFKKGDKLGFVPYITEEMIERALLAVKSKSNNEKQ